MKISRAAVVGLSMALACGLACGQPAENPPKGVPKPQGTPAPVPQTPSDTDGGLLFADPQIQFDFADHDFGKIFDDKPVEVEFKFKNIGAGPLIVTNVQTSCGCTTPDWDRQRKQYGPGEAGTIKIRFDPAHKSGIQTKTITVETNDRANPRAQLTIKSQITPLVQMEPTYLAFEPTPKGKGATKIVKVTGRKEGFKVSDVSVSPADIFSARVLGTKPTEINGEMLAQSEIEVTLKPTAPVGRFSATVNVQTNDERSKPMPLGLSGEVTGDLVLTPQQLMLGVLAPGAEFAGEVKVTRRDGKPWVLRGTELKSPAGETVKPQIKIEATRSEKGDGQVIKLTGKAPDQPGYRYSGELVLSTDVPGEESLRVRVMLTVRPTTPTSPGSPGFVAPAGGKPAPGKGPEPKSIEPAGPSGPPAAGVPTSASPK